MSDEVTYSAAFREAVRDEMAKDDTVFVIGTDLYHRGGHFAQVLGLGEEFGRDRIRDAPISEAAMVAAGVGAAMNGMRPIVDLNFIDFAFGAMDEIVNQAAKIRFMLGRPVPLVIRASSGIALGGAQHNNSPESWFANVPGLRVAVPATPYDVKGLMKTALRGEDPTIFLMHKKLSALRGPVGGLDDLVPFGSAVIRRPGDDCTLVCSGGTVAKTLEAAESLAASGVSAEVIDLRTLYPLDTEAITTSVRRTGRAVVVDEAPGFSSIAAEIAATIQEQCFEYLDGPVLRATSTHSSIPYSPPLIDAILPTVTGIVERVRQTSEAFSA
ncbi:transketolase C-terminal domain-containing protein [Asanoa sp. NPDC049573]|uniref:alpha-ketoacid dehydrogenase subunit beta n=1 Tax=Asanoa sp. NPDC049573 TaxID=3155396 RepID=UPI00341DF930